MSARGISTLFISASLRLGAVHSGFDVNVAWERMERAAADLRRHMRANVELQWTAPAPWLESETHQVKALEGRLHRIARELECIPQYTDDEKAVLRTLEEELKKAIAATSAHMGFSALLVSIAFGALLLAMLGPLLGVPMFFGIVIGVVFGVWWFVYLATSTHRPVQMAIPTKIDGLESRCEGRRHARRQSCIDEQRRTAAEIERVDHDRLSRIEAAELKRETAAAQVDSARSMAFQRIDQMRAGMLALRREYESLDINLKWEMLELERTAEQRQRDAYLDCQHIQRAQISGIGEARKQTLLSFGLETAFDVTEDALSQIPGFGPYLIGAMMAWKADVARRFKFDRSKGVPHSDKVQLQAKYAGIRRGLEGRLDNGEKEIHAIRIAYDKEISRIQESLR